MTGRRDGLMARGSDFGPPRIQVLPGEDDIDYPFQDLHWEDPDWKARP